MTFGKSRSKHSFYFCILLSCSVMSPNKGILNKICPYQKYSQSMVKIKLSQNENSSDKSTLQLQQSPLGTLLHIVLLGWLNT